MAFLSRLPLSCGRPAQIVPSRQEVLEVLPGVVVCDIATGARACSNYIPGRLGLDWVLELCVHTNCSHSFGRDEIDT